MSLQKVRSIVLKNQGTGFSSLKIQTTEASKGTPALIRNFLQSVSPIEKCIREHSLDAKQGCLEM